MHYNPTVMIQNLDLITSTRSFQRTLLHLVLPATHSSVNAVPSVHLGPSRMARKLEKIHRQSCIICRETSHNVRTTAMLSHANAIASAIAPGTLGLPPSILVNGSVACLLEGLLACFSASAPLRTDDVSLGPRLGRELPSVMAKRISILTCDGTDEVLRSWDKDVWMRSMSSGGMVSKTTVYTAKETNPNDE